MEWSVVIAAVAGAAAVASALNSHRTAKASREALRTNRLALERAYRPVLTPNDERQPTATPASYDIDFQNVGSGAAINVRGFVVALDAETDGKEAALGSTLRPLHVGSGQTRTFSMQAADERSLRGNPQWRVVLTYEDEAGSPHWTEARLNRRGGGENVQVGSGHRPPLWGSGSS